MDDEDLAVGRLLDDELDVVRLLFGGEAEHGQRVFRGRLRRTAVREHWHFLAPAGRYRREEDEGGDEEGSHPELGRAPGDVIVDVVVPKESEVDESSREAERREAGENAHDHVRRQAEDARRVRHTEEKGLPCAESLPVLSGEADGHQAGHLEARDRGKDGASEDERDDSLQGRQKGRRDLGIGDDAFRVSGQEESEEEQRPWRQQRECEGLSGDVGRDEAPPRPREVA